MAQIPVRPRETVSAARERGRQHRHQVRRQRLATLVPADRDPVEILVEQNASRVPDLVPLRFARMLVDPFAFYRGTAALMAADLAASPSTDLGVVACGDAHLSNFGVYASPERELVFDLNDFDEASAAPWDWDVKRLATSVVVAAHHAGHDTTSAREAARTTVGQYVAALTRVMDLGVVERHHLHVAPELVADRLSDGLQELVAETVRKARRRTSQRVAERLTEPDSHGVPRFRVDPPVLTPVTDEVWDQVNIAYQQYLHTVEPDIALLLQHFHLSDIARRVVGVGSVGTRCFLVLLSGPVGEPLVLQIKQAQQSVLDTYSSQRLPEQVARVTQRAGEGARVVALQKMLQATSDPFLGSLRVRRGDFYVRQFHDMKGSVEFGAADLATLTDYAVACATLLARAHSQSPNAAAVLGYVGRGRAASQAIADFAVSCAEKSQRDFDKLADAARNGRIPVTAESAG